MLPYQERRLLFPVDGYYELSENSISVIDIHKLPNIDFNGNIVSANQLYVGHPYIPNKYIPFDEYELVLIEDRIREFCQIAQSLGATEISVRVLNTSSTTE